MRILAACKTCQAQFDVSGRAPGSVLRCRCGGELIVPHARLEEARLVRCAACGATRGTGGSNCDYCGALFSIVDKGWGTVCPGCFGRLPNDAQYCVECGLKLNPQPLEALRTDLLCPRCKHALRGRTANAVDAFECASCGGMWVPENTFEAICLSKEGLGKARYLQGLISNSRHKFEISMDEQIKYIPCPICTKLMNRHNYAGVSGVIIDTCHHHGVWLDNQELSRIVKFIEAGGLEKAREYQARETAHTEKMKPKHPLPVSLLPVEHSDGNYKTDLAADAVCFALKVILEMFSQR